MDSESFDRMTIALMGASPTDETQMGLLDRQPVIQILPDANVIKIGGQSFIDRGRAAVFPLIDEVVENLPRHKMIIGTGAGTRARHAYSVGLDLGVPNIAVIIGEGGSGGAIAIASANRVLMLEHAIYTVISPEGAASILWRDTSKAQEAATNLKMTAEDLMRFGVIDQIVTEPAGGAHRDPAVAIASTGEAIGHALEELAGLDRETARRQRREKFLAIGRTLG